MPYGIPSMEEQLAAIRDANESGVALVHIDTCLGSFLNDHHNRPGELLIGVHVDGTTTVGEVKADLATELSIFGADRIPASVTDAMIAATLESLFDRVTPDDLFDSRLEKPPVEGDFGSDDLWEDAQNDWESNEQVQAWFVLTWETDAAKLRDRQDVSSVEELPDDRFEVTDDVGATFVGTFAEVTAWLEAGLDPEESES